MLQNLIDKGGKVNLFVRPRRFGKTLNLSMIRRFFEQEMDFDDVVVPDLRSEEFDWGGDGRTNFQGISLDYNRFNSDSILECYRLEYEAVKKYTPDIPVTTNLMGAYKVLDYQKWANDR